MIYDLNIDKKRKPNECESEASEIKQSMARVVSRQTWCMAAEKEPEKGKQKKLKEMTITHQ